MRRYPRCTYLGMAEATALGRSFYGQAYQDECSIALALRRHAAGVRNENGQSVLHVP
jgi:hypothetical protein